MSKNVWSKSLATTSYAAGRRVKREISPKENTKLTEVITIYEKLTKSRERSDADTFRFLHETNSSSASPSNGFVFK